jgi:hypothetical protein
MRSAQLLRKVEQLEAELKRLFDDLPHPVYRAMTYEELSRFSELMHEQIKQGINASVTDIPEALAIWKVACARIEKIFGGKQTWPHWRALWSDGD